MCFLLPDVRIVLPFSRYSIAVKFAVQQNSILVRIANGSFVNNMAALYEIALYITGYLSCFMLKYQEQMPFKSVCVYRNLHSWTSYIFPLSRMFIFFWLDSRLSGELTLPILKLKYFFSSCFCKYDGDISLKSFTNFLTLFF